MTIDDDFPICDVIMLSLFDVTADATSHTNKCAANVLNLTKILDF